MRLNLKSLLALMLFCSMASRAAVMEFTDRAAWLAVAGPVTNIGFEGIAPTGGRVNYTTPVTFSGVQFAAPLGSGGVAESAVSAGLDYVGAWGSGDKLQASLGVEFDIMLPSGVTAVGSDIMITSTFFFGTSGSYSVMLSTGDVFTNISSSGPPTRSFVGFISTTPISSIRMISNPSLAMIDNFAFNSVAAPEPSSLTLFGAGVMFIALMRNGRLKPARTKTRNREVAERSDPRCCTERVVSKRCPSNCAV